MKSKCEFTSGEGPSGFKVVTRVEDLFNQALMYNSTCEVSA